jgi:hypothetical protein
LPGCANWQVDSEGVVWPEGQQCHSMAPHLDTVECIKIRAALHTIWWVL